MRILIQECLEATLKIDGVEHARIGKGEVIFVGFTEGDTRETIVKMIEKLLKLRIFSDEEGKTNITLAEHGGDILAVSQFTLYADLRKGNRPSFVRALGSLKSKPLFDIFKEELSSRMEKTQYGVFGADMKVGLINDGPFTIWLDSEELGL